MMRVTLIPQSYKTSESSSKSFLKRLEFACLNSVGSNITTNYETLFSNWLRVLRISTIAGASACHSILLDSWKLLWSETKPDQYRFVYYSCNSLFWISKIWLSSISSCWLSTWISWFGILRIKFYHKSVIFYILAF